MGPKALLGGLRVRDNQLGFLPQQGGPQPSPTHCGPGGSRMTISIESGSESRKEGEKAAPGEDRVRGGRREVTGAEKVAQAPSLKLCSWALPGGCGTVAQYLQDPVVTVRVKSTSSQHNQAQSWR